jgi:hypothetical protein
MFIAACLFVSLCAPPKMTAVVTPGRVLEVTVNGKIRVLEAADSVRWKLSWEDVAERAFRKAPREGLLFKGRKYTVNGYAIVNTETGKTFTITWPKTKGGWPAGGELQGGIALDGAIVLVYAQFPPEGMVPPCVGVSAAVVCDKDGELIQEKIVDMNGIAQGHSGVVAYRRGNELVVQSSAGTFGVIDLRTYEFTVVQPYNPDKWMCTVRSDSGRIYRQDGRTVKLWDWVTRKWNAVSRLDPYEWSKAYGLNNDDLLVSDRAIALARSGKTYRVWPLNGNRWGCRLYLDRELGVGVTTVKEGLGETGVFLSLKDLSVLCRITGKPK